MMYYMHIDNYNILYYISDITVAPTFINDLYNRTLIRKLPAEERNFQIIKNINFFKILSYPLKQDKKAIISWVKQYESKLKNLLQNNKDKIENKEHSVYCRNINYLIDIIMQRINMFKGIEKIKWTDEIHEISKRVLKDNSLIKCERNLDNIDNRYVYVKKMMHDLCEDIDYMMKDEQILNDKRCSKFIERIEYRKDTLMKIYNSFNYGINFLFDNQCTIPYIKENFEKLKCKPKEEPTEAIANNENTMIAQTQTNVQETQEEDVEDLGSL
ncbi:hypothetical protein PVNG_05336 [Plasmodium vivax North Korean]|uniref:Uncharacterized protein n=1 Tax=Plasmodium vivax North Korean TaxID=1035514 RepID=A0A0J9TY05_PLAVI|nr:hypothetical protein PVNG_05336 [Plasmodium vivax North Korean]